MRATIHQTIWVKSAWESRMRSFSSHWPSEAAPCGYRGAAPGKCPYQGSLLNTAQTEEAASLWVRQFEGWFTASRVSEAYNYMGSLCVDLTHTWARGSAGSFSFSAPLWMWHCAVGSFREGSTRACVSEWVRARLCECALWEAKDEEEAEEERRAWGFCLVEIAQIDQQLPLWIWWMYDQWMWCPYISSTENFLTHLVSRLREYPNACAGVCVFVRACERAVVLIILLMRVFAWGSWVDTAIIPPPPLLPLEFQTCNRRWGAGTHLAARFRAAERAAALYFYQRSWTLWWIWSSLKSLRGSSVSAASVHSSCGGNWTSCFSFVAIPL